ncbi:hypothetical protein BCR41DRAFT_373447 [Lobosporangium transversale]|uniref:Uncharacterized protein n=1 Tax=Lobosporangium transversale TaxID=64571 RepID=A0A1Y2GI32_9FUNG|nr:hypothetical protein BCR41DRAFT_373447 [Lobosporangium transversale]ORZ08056.1 hypothetical protein BCR41DRAFT_373447 [Lobosporangium transversale]|eukprot:XP_021878290.1 hypothetical protein BCR41DRAFT_373447 [Lobosporangium transversale]
MYLLTMYFSNRFFFLLLIWGLDAYGRRIMLKNKVDEHCFQLINDTDQAKRSSSRSCFVALSTHLFIILDCFCVHFSGNQNFSIGINSVRWRDIVSIWRAAQLFLYKDQ